MNKRQKLVQAQFLNNEEAVIRRLKSVYSASQKEIEKKAQALQEDINRLDTMAKLSVDADEKAKLLSMKQSKVYQKQYQEALKTQINSVLDNMQVEEFKTVSEYLQKCYEDGFIGTMFDLHGQGIPLCFPLDQEAMVRAVQLDSKISKGLYSRLGEDITLLKRKISAQVSRGIATGMSFQQVAQQLAATSNIGFNNAVRIARTEGHRIQVQSGMDACYKAKEKGADVVKQWDSTLDSKTRESHQAVDGEIRELDEPFSNGLMFPGDPSGSAEEVICCRCALLQRARWALDDDELETLKERAAFYGLDKADSFDDFKTKYLKAAKQIQNEELQQSLSEALANCKTAKEVSEAATKYFVAKSGSKIDYISFDKIDVSAAKDMVLKLDDLDTRFNSSFKRISSGYMNGGISGQCTPTSDSFEKYLVSGDPGVLESTIRLNRDYLRSKKVIASDFNSVHRSKYGGVAHSSWIDEKYASVSTLVHEYGHSILPGKANEIYLDEGGSNPAFMSARRLYRQYTRKLNDLQKQIRDIRDSFAGQPDGLAKGLEAAKHIQAEYDSLCISNYSKESVGEFIAEAFCDYELSENPKSISVKVHEMLVKSFGKGEGV